MDKAKKEKLEKLREIKENAQADLKEKHGYEDCIVKNVIHYNKKVELVNKKTKKKEQFDLCTIIVEDPKTKEEIILYYLNGKEVDYTAIIIEYESPEPIKDLINNTKENESKQDKEKDPELVTDNLNELEQKEKEESKIEEQDKIKEKEKSQVEQKEKRKPNHVIESIEPDKAKLDYWKNIKQAFDLPERVHTIAFSYPTSKDDKIDYANITVHMLDKDGYIIDDIKVDDYFEFDSSTGNNPINDNTVRFEEDENRDKAQINGNNTMVRLKAKNSQDNNTYISLEQKNNIGDNNDINAGRKVVAGTQNVEKQLETNKLRVWDSERERLVSGRAGIYNINDIYEEADEHKEHGDEEYIKNENADGNENTIEICESLYIPGTDKTWEELSEETGESISKLQERFEHKLEEGENPEDILEEIEYDYEMIGPNRDKR